MRPSSLMKSRSGNILSGKPILRSGKRRTGTAISRRNAMKQTTPLELIDTPKSGNAWKVRLLCAYLGIPITRHPMSIVDGDLNSDAFAQKNPLQMVPVLKTREGEWLSESSAILWYLAKGSPFLPDDTLTQSRIVYWMVFEQTQHMVNFAQPRLQIHLRQLREVHDPCMVAYRRAGHQALRIMEKRLTESPFL